MTDRTNLIHRLAELRAGVLWRIRLNWREHRAGVPAWVETQRRHNTHSILQSLLAGIDASADAADLTREVRKSTRRLYWRHLVPVRRGELTLAAVLPSFSDAAQTVAA